jgi:hypothetical protein
MLAISVPGQQITRGGSAEESTVGRLGGLAQVEAERGEKALWLSGAGYRAALFHLGALTRLNELGLLARTGTVGTVGGGAIAAAFLATRVGWPLHGADRDWPERVAEPLRGAARRSFRARSLLRLQLAGGPAAVPEERCARELIAALGGEYERGPRFVFGASGLTLSGLAAGWEEGLEWRLADPSPGGYDEDLVGAAIAAVRADLDGLSGGEAAVLENHGYLLADAAVRRHAAVGVAIEPLPPLPPHPRWLDPGRVREALAGGGRRSPLGGLRPRRAAGRRPEPRSPELTALLERHRPLLVYDSLECCRAGSAAHICELARAGRSNGLHRADGTLVASSRGEGTAHLDLDFLGAIYGNGEEAQRDHYLDESGAALAADVLSLRSAAGEDGEVAYGRARRDPDGTVWLQYWLFFYFGDRGHLGFEQREGGWELAQLRLGADGAPAALVLGRPGGGLALTPEQLETVAGDEGPVAVVYPARGSHAPLPRPGCFAAPVAPDHSDGAGARQRPRLEPIGDDGPGWALWPGRWGATRRREFFEADSPRGPGGGREWWDPAAVERAARPWAGETFAGGCAPPAPRLRAWFEGGSAAAVEYSFPPNPTQASAAGQAAPARIVAAPVDAGGTVGPPLACAADPGGGGLALQLPSGHRWVSVRAAAASALGVSGPGAEAAIEERERAG